MDEPVAACHVVIHGRVQGVGYRSWVAGNAKKTGLVGWVRNRNDGTVEAIFQGTQQQVDVMLARCKSGPLAAKVGRVDVNHLAVDESLEGFWRKDTV